MKKVQVLMSTYNGEKYLREQIDSILAQKGVEIHLLVRDDGSKDNTVEILKKYKDIEIIQAKNVGATNSFLNLIELAGDYDFYAFADQDDVWDEDKIYVAISRLEIYDCPAIYSGNTRLVDKELNLIKCETLNPLTTLGSAIVKNYVTGCTTVFNHELMSRLKEYKPQYAPFHDWWVNLVCLSVGGVSIYDFKPHINYRQHDNNVVSGNESFLKKWKSRFHKFMKKPYHRDRMAVEIIEYYENEIGAENKRILHAMKDSKYINEMKTGNKTDDFLFRISMMLGKV